MGIAGRKTCILRPVNETLVMRVAVAVVDALKARGHILVVKGGVESLVRELSQLMATSLGKIAPGLGPRAAVVSEVTSTFGSELVDEIIEEMVLRVTHALMDSEHVEDVFAEDNVIRRDVFRTVRDALTQPAGPGEEDDDDEGEGAVSVRLDELGYVAKMVAVGADTMTLREALERAGESVSAALDKYDPGTREATFVAPGGDSDRRIELEETVADELAELVDLGLVDLPTVVREVELVRAVDVAERKDLEPRIDELSTSTLVRSGCAVTWEHTGMRALTVTFTPMSEHDTRDLERHVAAFAREVNGLLGTSFPDAGASPPRSAAGDGGASLADAAGELLRRARVGSRDAKPAAKVKTPKGAATRKKPAAGKAAAKAAVSDKPAAPAAKKTAAKRASKAPRKP